MGGVLLPFTLAFPPGHPHCSLARQFPTWCADGRMGNWRIFHTFKIKVISAPARRKTTEKGRGKRKIKECWERQKRWQWNEKRTRKLMGGGGGGGDFNKKLEKFTTMECDGVKKTFMSIFIYFEIKKMKL